MELITLLVIEMIIVNGLAYRNLKTREILIQAWREGRLDEKQLRWLNKQPWFVYKVKTRTPHEKLE
jgi:hypothetical protein